MNKRRSVLKSILSLGIVTAIAPMAHASKRNSDTEARLKGNIHHSVCRWCFHDIPLDELAHEAQRMGLSGIDLIGPGEWHILKAHGLECTMCNGAEISLEDGWNERSNHAELVRNYTEHINLVAEAGYKNLICFSGNRRGMDEETGLKNCVEGLKKVLVQAEKRGVTLHMELFNSKVDHPDYMCDNTSWGIELCKRIDSPNFKLLYDIYHMQISEGDIIRTITEHHSWFGHYHTAGVPGRHEINENQELYYPAIMRAIVETGYKGYVAQEFIPTNPDKLRALKEAIRLCDV